MLSMIVHRSESQTMISATNGVAAILYFRLTYAGYLFHRSYRYDFHNRCIQIIRLQLLEISKSFLHFYGRDTFCRFFFFEISAWCFDLFKLFLAHFTPFDIFIHFSFLYNCVFNFLRIFFTNCRHFLLFSQVFFFNIHLFPVTIFTFSLYFRTFAHHSQRLFLITYFVSTNSNLSLLHYFFNLFVFLYTFHISPRVFPTIPLFSCTFLIELCNFVKSKSNS